MKNRQKQVEPFDRAAEKAAARRQDLDDLAARKISHAELARKNAFFGCFDMREARIVNSPEDKLKL